MERSAAALPPGEVVRLSEQVAYQKGSVVSRTLVKEGGATLTLFAFDDGQGLSEHTTPFDALLTVLDGEAAVTVGGRASPVRAGESILLPARVPHAVQAATAFKMLLVMVKKA